jgi:DNA-binding GntR family transcriptional regulator
MNTASALPRLSKAELPDSAASALRTAIVSGRLQPGERVTERDVAERFGISRTPVREAFFQLQRDGLLADHPGRGLLVSALSEDEIRDIYQLLAALERAALRHTICFPRRMIERLREASRRRRSAASDIAKIVVADRAWHEALTGASANARLSGAMAAPRALAERYERAFFRHASNQQRSDSEHEEIEAAVAAGALDRAADLVESHWLGNIEAMAAAVSSAKGEAG